MKLKIATQEVCSGCRALEAYLEAKHPELEYEEIHIDKEPDTIQEYGLMSTPTVLLWDEEGEMELSRMVGYVAGRDTEQLEELISMLG